MFVKDLNNGFVIREVSEKEIKEILRTHFAQVFQNRLEHSIPLQIEDTDEAKIKDRAKEDKRFRLRLVLFYNSKPIGWHFGYSVDSETYYMQNSAILEEFRNKGLYHVLLKAVLEKLKQEGFQVVTSSHHANNAAVLIPKLKAGFIICSLQFHERFRFLVDLKYFFNEERRKAFGENMGLGL